MNTKQYFSDLKSALENRNEAIKTALEYCRTKEQQIKARYSETVAAEKLAELEADARATIQKHDQEAHDKAEKAVEALRGELAEHITGGTDPGVLPQLQAVQSFNLHLTRSEIEAMAAKSGGNPITLAVLAQAAERSGFKVSFTTAADLEDDLKKVLSMFSTPSHYTPDGLFSEGLKYHPNRMYRGIDYGRPDATSLSARMKPNEDAPGQLEEMSARWSDPGKVELKEIAPVPPM